MRGRQRQAASPINKDTRKYFAVNVYLHDTSETYTLKKVYNEMTIRQLKEYTEFVTGIPYNIQRLTYLDEGDLLEHTDIRHNDIVPGGTLNLKVWYTWRTLVEAAASNDAEWLFQLGVTEDGSFKTPNSDVMSPKAKKEWIAERAFVALYIAAHRGHMKLCEKLLEAGANINASTSLGRTALHVAAARGHSSIVDLLLGEGANISAADRNGDTALTVAGQFGHKACERHLFLFRWQERAQSVKPNIEHGMFAHQYFDSAFPVWLKGGHGQVYFTNILPPGEYEGTRFDAPRRGTGYTPTPMEDHISTRQTSFTEDTKSPEVINEQDSSQREVQEARTAVRARIKSPTERMTPITEQAESTRRGSASSPIKQVSTKPTKGPRSTGKNDKPIKEQEKAKQVCKRRPLEKQKDKKPVDILSDDKKDKAKTTDKKPTWLTTSGPSPPKEEKSKDGLVRDWFQHKDKKWSAYEMWQRRNEIDLIEEIRAGNIPEAMKTY